MSKNSCFRGPLDKSHDKWADTLSKSERGHLHHIYWSLLRIFRLKKSLWVIWKILGLFLNPLTPDNKCSLLNRDNLQQHFQIHWSQKRELFPNFFLFCKFRHHFEHFQIRQYLTYFLTYGLRKTWLDKHLKSPVSEDPLKVTL